MKKIILLLIIAVVSVPSLSAQSYKLKREKPCWFDFQIAQHIGLNSWSDVSYISDGLPAASITEIRGAFNFYLANPIFGAYIDMGLGIMPAPNMRSFTPGKMPMPNSGTQYYLREMVSESGPNKASAHFKIDAGLFGDIKATDRLNVMPYLGIGGITMSRRSFEMILKESGSNMQYNASYMWGRNVGQESYSDSEMLGYVNARLNFRYKISARASLLFGLEYTYFFDTIDFYGKYSNTFNGNVQKSITVEGNNMNMLGLSIGLSFR